MAGFRVSFAALIAVGVSAAGLAQAAPDQTVAHDDARTTPLATLSAADVPQVATVRIGQFDLRSLHAEAFADWDQTPTVAAPMPAAHH